MELILIRHGLPERRHDTSNPPLAAKGLDQAHRVAAWLADEKVDAVFASTMLRAIQTAEPFAAQAFSYSSGVSRMARMSCMGSAFSGLSGFL